MFSSSRVIAGLILVVALGGLVALGAVLRGTPSTEQEPREVPAATTSSGEENDPQPNDGLLVVNIRDLYPEGRPSLETFAKEGGTELPLAEIEAISDEVRKMRPTMLEIFEESKLIEPLWIFPDGTVMVTSSYPQDEGTLLASKLADQTALRIEHRQVPFGRGELQPEMDKISDLLTEEFARNPEDQGVLNWYVSPYDGRIWVETLEGYGEAAAVVLNGLDRDKVIIVEDPDGTRVRTLPWPESG